MLKVDETYIAQTKAEPRRRSWWPVAGTIVFILCAAAFPFLAKAIGDPSLVGLVTRIAIYAIAAASLNLILGYGGLVSFGHAAYFGVGGYVVGILYNHYISGDPFWGFIPGTNQLLITIPAAIIISGLFALVLGALSLRTSGVPFIMITLAFAQMLYFLFVSLKAYGGDDGLIVRRRNVLFDLPMADDTTFYYVTIGIAVLYFIVFAKLVRSQFGIVLGGIRQNERRMAAIGISTYQYKLVAFVIAGMGAGLAGALMANYSKFVSPDMLHWTKSGDLMIMIIIGGTGTLLGPVLGAAALIGLETYLTSWTEHWKFFLGPILILIVLFSSGGLTSVFSGWSRKRE
ncbi:branched-chain amino acid ABC transporter permease [Pseudorhodoplanes sinuspersici]|uniref:Branched-chain amino acid ABC transporter permease n=1 Tax=Pseudorhodoplanes sinuspersici TaxID=1235591 RepID=A0A1W6ZYH5_9HYPH|nr:branched-chain amino acid ABC transporter permease [Pseudorhodoplanes sinuspersici]ARQ02386.1 branched-chain amino acid ABC transporter permease [Pseudorhodoplanes sinuspersici]RKE74216.1 amino acid/amide ABC transporter membrane protein 2 (HAAT family) [Pseudorhodoplanes sinuspersici]